MAFSSIQQANLKPKRLPIWIEKIYCEKNVYYDRFQSLPGSAHIIVYTHSDPTHGGKFLTEQRWNDTLMKFVVVNL